MEEHEKPWNPITVEDVSRLFSAAPFHWWIAGGIALELAVGCAIRKHSDIDVLLLRHDHMAARKLFGVWDCWVADPPGALRHWPQEERLEESVHDVWCRKTSEDDWQLQLMLDEAGGGDWVSRRDYRVRAPIREITRITQTGVRYLAPHIQLYYKAKNPREKDEVDFDAVLQSGISLESGWLRNAISLSYGAQHPWLARLNE